MTTVDIDMIHNNGVAKNISIRFETSEPVPPTEPRWLESFVDYHHIFDDDGVTPKVIATLNWDPPKYNGNAKIRGYEFKHTPGDPTACELEK